MASALTDKLSRLVKTLSGQARITESNVADMLREVRMALLEADVALPVVRDFIARVKEKALGQEVMGSLKPGQALVGVVNVPIIYFSVQWWNTLHQGASVSLTKSPSMAAIMLWAMLVMTLAFWAYAVGMAFYRVRQTILEREQDAAWVGELKEIAP